MNGCITANKCISTCTRSSTGAMFCFLSFLNRQSPSTTNKQLIHFRFTRCSRETLCSGFHISTVKYLYKVITVCIMDKEYRILQTRSHDIAFKTRNLCLKIVHLLYSDVRNQALTFIVMIIFDPHCVYKLFALMKLSDNFICVHLIDSANDD
ncbi:hypothetical protein D917_02338 [Trichinella nativa]|uniref:Uncharacterized protein n=1 Tax=Trichinella nativa TaxID=6335 RepID=A0A1Y3EGE2_9BILA|nr:hypothetical protein D917_02338 [Trichinella nativa]